MTEKEIKEEIRRRRNITEVDNLLFELYDSVMNSVEEIKNKIFGE